jgi:CHAT domain-containing protein/tetratricopeptide (TPR) repeat protein
MEIKVKEWGPDAPDLAHGYQELGLVLERRGRPTEAETELRRALAVREKHLGPVHPDVALSLLALGELLAASPARQEEATALLDRTIRILDATPAGPQAQARAYARRASLRYGRGQPRPARDDLARALDIVEGMRPEAGGAEWTRARFLAQYADDFQRMVGWRVDDGDLDGAIRTAERGRSRALLDQLAAARVDLRAGIDPEERRALEARESDARARVAESSSRLERLLAEKEPTEEALADVVALEKEKAAALGEFERLYQEIRNASRLWRGKVGLGDVVGLADVQRELVPRRGLVLYYSVGAEGSFLFVIPPAGGAAKAFPLSVPESAAAVFGVGPGALTRSSLRQILAPSAAGGRRGLLAQLAEPPRPASQASLDAALHALFEALVPPEVWARVRAAAEVVVVPDDLVHRVPLEALVVKVAGAEGSSRYWLDEGPAVRYEASATVAHVLALRKAPGREVRAIVSVSDPIFDREDVRRLTATSVSAPPPAPPRTTGPGWDLVRLPGTAREAEAIRAAFEGSGRPLEMLSQLDAREGLVRKRLPSARYVHFATHGLVDEVGGGIFASLALTPPPEPGGPEDDGQLQLYEIYGLEMDAELAVLSSCETRVGTLMPGEGVFALSRGFLVAGARRVVASLWPAADDATAGVVGSFFRAVARSGETAPAYARALAEAKADVRRQPAWSAPFFWAPFVLDGAR